MKTVRMSVVLASMAGAASLFLGVPAAMSASPEVAWEFYYIGENPPAAEGASYQGTSMASAPDEGFDLFNVNAIAKNERSSQAYMGTSLESGATSGWDVFRVGEGDSLP